MEAIFLNCNQELSLSKRKRVIPAKGCYEPGKSAISQPELPDICPSFLSLKPKDWKNLYFDYLPDATLNDVKQAPELFPQYVRV